MARPVPPHNRSIIETRLAMQANNSTATLSPETEKAAVDLTRWVDLGSDIQINEAAYTPLARTLLKPDALNLVAALHRQLDDGRRQLLERRRTAQADFDAGAVPTYLVGHESDVRGDWQVGRLPADLLRRRVEITGPVGNAKMVINMLSRGADGHMADAAMLDFEDSQKPSWTNVMQGVANVRDAARGSLTFEQPARGDKLGKVYAIDPDDMPLVMVRVRGLHLNEVNLLVDGQPVSGGLMEFALSMFYSASALLENGKTPKYYIPKCEHYLEARWWNQLFALTQQHLGIPTGTIKATFLIETLTAAFQMEEILFEIREHAAGLNGGRWDKIFSDIKTLQNHPDRIMADRASISMNRQWMKDYVLHLIRVCHKHGAFGMGGMAAFTPGKSPERREEQIQKVIEDKKFESSIGHDGCWVSHPYFIGPALSAFPRDNQLDVVPQMEEFPDLLPKSEGPKTMAGLRTNVRVGIAYMKGWNSDVGCVAWDDLMEDLATLEISRAQTWQWVHHGVVLDDGTQVTRELVQSVFAEELALIKAEVRVQMKGSLMQDLETEFNRFEAAALDAESIFLEEHFRSFLTFESEVAGASRLTKRRLVRNAK